MIINYYLIHTSQLFVLFTNTAKIIIKKKKTKQYHIPNLKFENAIIALLLLIVVVTFFLIGKLLII